MNILVLIKYSLDVAEIKVDPNTSELRLAGVPAKIGNIDKIVVEAAVQMIEKYGGSLRALTLGPAVAQPSYREVLAMGLDEVTLVEDPFDGQADAKTGLSILQAAIEKLGPFDLIVCGFASDDGYSFQFAPRLAERLALPLVSYVRKMEVEDNILKADQELDDYAQTVSVQLPAVVSIDEEAFVPRQNHFNGCPQGQEETRDHLACGRGFRPKNHSIEGGTIYRIRLTNRYCCPSKTAHAEK